MKERPATSSARLDQSARRRVRRTDGETDFIAQLLPNAGPLNMNSNNKDVLEEAFCVAMRSFALAPCARRMVRRFQSAEFEGGLNAKPKLLPDQLISDATAHAPDVRAHAIFQMFLGRPERPPPTSRHVCTTLNSRRGRSIEGGKLTEGFEPLRLKIIRAPKSPFQASVREFSTEVLPRLFCADVMMICLFRYQLPFLTAAFTTRIVAGRTPRR